jgi:hypothetical protein
MYVKVRGFQGIACYTAGHPKVFVPGIDTYIDDDGEEFEAESDDPELGEWIDDENKLYVVMVGDDHKHVVDVDDVEELPTSEFCHECGQIGCCQAVYADDEE